MTFKEDIIFYAGEDLITFREEMKVKLKEIESEIDRRIRKYVE